MRFKIVLAVILLGIIFPMRWISQFSAAYGQTFEAIFSPEWAHVVMHAALYAGLGATLMLVTRLPLRGKNLLVLSLLFLGVGILQELFQWLTLDKAVPIISLLRSSLFDLGVDLLGGLLGLAAIFWAYRRPDWRKSQVNHR